MTPVTEFARSYLIDSQERLQQCANECLIGQMLIDKGEFNYVAKVGIEIFNPKTNKRDSRIVYAEDSNLGKAIKRAYKKTARFRNRKVPLNIGFNWEVVLKVSNGKRIVIPLKYLEEFEPFKKEKKND